MNPIRATGNPQHSPFPFVSQYIATCIYARVTPKKLFEDMDRFVEATRDLKLIL